MVDLINFSTFTLPNVDVTGLITYGLIFTNVTFLIIAIVKLFTHRVLIKKLSVVNNGIVITTGRYKIDFDYDSKLEYLRPMFGNARLPPFPSYCFQKVKSFPFIGINRQINMIFPNKYNPCVSIPTNDIEQISIIKKPDVQRWFFMNERSKFIKKFNQVNIIEHLAVIAPLVIIVGAFLFWATCIFLQYQMTGSTSDHINSLTQALLTHINSG